MPETNSSVEMRDSFDDCILYELLVYSEWKQDPELLKYLKGELHQSYTQYILQFFRKQDSSDDVRRILLHQLPWHFAVGEGGKVVAILQDTVLEIRTSRDEYSSVVGKASIAKDPTPQWRKLSWSPDCSMLAVGHSNGVVSFYDLLGSNIFNIYPQRFQEYQQQQSDKNTSLAFLGFIQSRRKSPKWSAELVLVDYQGEMRCYLVSPTDGYQESHNFSFSEHYPHGITAVSYHSTHNMLFLAGPSSLKHLDVLKDLGSSLGLSAWRLLNDYPYCTIALSSDEEQAIWQAQRSWWNWVPSVSVKKKQSIIFKMQISPGGKFLACLHSCGSFSIWHLPGIRLYKRWSLQEQPDYNARNPLDKRRSDYSSEYWCHPVDVNWWSDQAVIIARHSGAISVCSVGNLHNLLGESPEFLAGSPQVSALCSDQGFLGLECETVSISKKWAWDEHTMYSEMESSDDNDDDSDDDASLLNKSSALLQSAVYVVTDIERFQPKKKKPKLCVKTYRLLGLKSTTPDELYARKIDNEEYGEALALAKAYNLDCDLVYQQQWRNNKVSIVTIHDYLSKVTKRTWGLKECVERVPETFDAARELLEFGLQETSAEKLFSFGDEEMLDLDSSIEIDAAEKMKKMKESLSMISLNDLTSEQQTLLRYRQQLLEYFDRLCTYELIMGGPHMAEDCYDYMFYDKFRTVSLIESTMKFARESNWKAVETMFTYHGSIILPHWLAVLSNFPETMNPYEYRSLLPECDSTGHLFQWSEIQLRTQDWCEKSNFEYFCKSNRESDAEFIYQEDESLQQFIFNDGVMSADILTSWFVNRVHKIESQSCMVDYALSLTKLGKEKNVTGLENLYNQLLTLDTLVYDVHLENVRLLDLQKMSQLDICKLLMSKSNETTFIDDLKHFLLPFLLRCEKMSLSSRKQLLHAYLVELSSHDLSLPLKMFEYIHNENPNQLVPTVEEKMSLALSSIYAYPNSDQLSIAFKILDYVPEKSFGSLNSAAAALQNKLNELECDLHAAEILEHNSICKPLSFLQDSKSVANVAQQLLVRLARNIAKKIQPPTDNEWKQLLTDILDLQRICFTCVSVETCFEIYGATLLASGSEKNIKSTVELLECHQADYSGRKISYNNSVKLVLNAALEYFDSAGSLDDPALELARTCLNLIMDEHDIRELQDLITALQLLSDFGINMLPLQVRLCSERLRLVEMSIHSKASAYRNTQKIFQLAHKLRVCGEDQRLREGKVLVLIAEAALEALDYQFCAEICQLLVSKCHTNGWQIVQKLGQCEEYDNFSLRCDLLGFALLFCPDDLIEVLLNTRSFLEVQLLHNKINTLLKQEAISDEEEFSDALTSPLTPNKEFQSLINVIEEAVEPAVRNSAYVSPSTPGSKSLSVSADDSVTSGTYSFSQQGFPAFYSSLEPDCHASSLCTQYDKFSEPVIMDPVLKVSQSFLRSLQLEGTISHGRFVNNTKVLLQTAEKCLPEDLCLGLSHIFPVQELILIDSCFSHLACSSLALQVAAYYYALKGYKKLQNPSTRNRENQHNIYYTPPNKLIEHMSRIALKLEEPAEWADFLLKYKKLMIDFQQGQKLQDLGCGVDLRRFTHDKEYQQDSILGLAMTADSEKFSLAVTLATHHGLAVGEVVARHITSLLLNEDGNQNSDLASHLNDPKLMELIKMSPHLICDRLFQYAYPHIEGTDHQLLLSYYTALQNIAEDYTSYSLIPKEHIKLIRKVKLATTDINYKKLVDSSYNILDVVIPSLQRNNIGMIAKLLKSLPSTLKCAVEPGKLYSSWAQKEFFNTSVSTAHATTEDWLEQYELCAAHFNKMTATDVLDFIKGTCFSEHGVDSMSTECREDIINRVKAHCQLKIIYPMEEEVDEWNEAIKTLDHYLVHLKIVSSFEAEDFYRNSEECRQLVRIFSLSRGDTGQVDRILQMAVANSMPADVFKQFVSLLPHSSQTFEQCLLALLKTAIARFRCRNGEEEAKQLYCTLQRIQESLHEDSSIRPQEVECLCGDSNLSPETRLKALEILQSLKPHAVQSDAMLLYRHTQATIASAWSQTPVSLQESDVETEESRRLLFSKLLQHASAWRHLIVLKDLLNTWPSFNESDISRESANPWVQLTYRMLTSENRTSEDMELALEDIFKSTKLSPSSIQHLVSMTEDSTYFSHLLLLCLLPKEPTLASTVYSLIHKHVHADDPPLSKKLLSLLLKNGLASTLISTPVYAQMIEYMLENCASDTALWKSVINQLMESGHYAEAGTIHHLQMGVSSSLNVFSASLAFAKARLSEE